MDINEALTFDPESTELRFCEPDESPNANALLMSYLNDFISIEANGQRIPIKLENKSLKGEGINTALQISFEYQDLLDNPYFQACILSRLNLKTLFQKYRPLV